METGETEAREELRLVIFDKRDLTRVVVAKRMDDAVNSVDTINSFCIIIDKVLLALVLVQIGFSKSDLETVLVLLVTKHCIVCLTPCL